MGTLISSKPILQAKLQKLLHKAAYEAQVSMMNDGECNQSLKTKLEADMRKSALQWANKFSQEASGPLADAIYEFVKEIGIVATPSGTLMSPPGVAGGPCFGVIPMTDFKII